MKDSIFHPWAIPDNTRVREKFVLFQEKQMLYLKVTHATGLSFKARGVAVPLYSSFANPMLGSTT